MHFRFRMTFHFFSFFASTTSLHLGTKAEYTTALLPFYFFSIKAFTSSGTGIIVSTSITYPDHSQRALQYLARQLLSFGLEKTRDVLALRGWSLLHLGLENIANSLEGFHRTRIDGNPSLFWSYIGFCLLFYLKKVRGANLLLTRLLLVFARDLIVLSSSNGHRSTPSSPDTLLVISPPSRAHIRRTGQSTNPSSEKLSASFSGCWNPSLALNQCQ